METQERVELTGQQARQLRAMRGWSRERLREETGLSVRMILDFESGKRQPHPSNLAKIMAALDYSGDEVVTRAAWPKDLTEFFDLLAALLAPMSFEERAAEYRALFQDIGQRHLHRT